MISKANSQMNPKVIAAFQLQDRLGVAIKREREALNVVLDLIIEAMRERSFLTLGFSTMEAWLMNHFEFSETSAKRRIASAKLKSAVPSVDEKIESGALNVTTLTMAQSAIRAEEIRTKTKITPEAKTPLIEQISNKKGHETAKILMREFPHAEIFAQEKTCVVSQENMQVQIVISHEDFEVLQRAKELLSHSVPDGSLGKVIATVCREFVKRKDPLREETKREQHVDEKVRGSKNADIPSTRSSQKTRYISKPVLRAVFRRDGGACQFRNPVTGGICGSRYQVQVDHVEPWALGGSNEMENLRCLCGQHNRHIAEARFGSYRSV